MKYLLLASLFLHSIVFATPQSSTPSSSSRSTPSVSQNSLYDAPAIPSRKNNAITEYSTVLKSPNAPSASSSIVFQTPLKSGVIVSPPLHKSPLIVSSHQNSHFTGKRSLILSSSYFHYSSRGLADFALSLSDGFEWMGEKILAKVSPASRSFIGSIYALITLYIYENYTVAFHEIGHGLHHRSRGGTFGLYSNGVPVKNTLYKKKENIFRFFFNRLSSMEFSGAFTTPNPDDEYARAIDAIRTNSSLDKTAREQEIKKIEDSKEYKASGICWDAGGMNNETYLSERHTDLMFQNKYGHRLGWFFSLYNKIHPLVYSIVVKADNLGDDPTSLTKNYNDYKIIPEVQTSDFITAYIVSILCSGTTYTGIMSLFRHTDVCSPEFHKFRIPETFVYLTSKGIAYRIKSGYRLNDETQLIFGTEFIGKGEKAIEGIVGAHRTFNSLKELGLTSILTFGKKLNLDLSLNIPLMHRFFFNIGYSTYSADSLYGERHALKNTFKERRSHEFWVSLSKQF